MQIVQLLRRPAVLVLSLALMMQAVVAQAADRDKIIAFMQVTGFDVALDSLRLSAGSAPAMLGLEENDFGADWTLLADEVFEESQMRADAVDILARTLSDEALAFAAEFYASPLGQRLVEAGNASHMMDDAIKEAEGQEVAAQLMLEESPRLEIFEAMGEAIGSQEDSIKRITEIQVRFIMSAQAAGLVDGQMSEEDLRGAILSQAEEIKMSMRLNALTGNAYTYRDFSDADMQAYLDALRDPLMQEVYELMSAVQFTIQVDRFEILAAKMIELHPSQEL